MPILQRFILIGFFCSISAGVFAGASAGASAGVTEISPSMGGTEINELLNSARPGDTLLFLPGTYKGPFVLTEVHGDINLPVVITGASMQKEGTENQIEGAANQMEGAAMIDGKTDPGMNLKHHAFLLQDCSWISIENFTIKNCWTDLIRAEDVSYLSVRHCKMTGGKRALFATGRGSHHFLVEHCSWEQDERVWTHAGDYSWDEIHHGVHKHFNGSLFQGSEISGVFVLRDNLIKNTFNAFRLSQMNDGAMDLLACTNGEIYGNTIINTSDNVLEPEVHTLNLHFYHNQMINGHAFVSITEVAGGEIYIYGNTAVSKPESDDGWTIFKISSGKKGLTKPFYIFNNSWHVDFDMIGSPRNVWQNNHLRHFNNACFSTKSDSFGIYNMGMDNHFDYDCSNVPFPELLTRNGFEKNGLVADPLFLDPLGNDFRLKENSPCIDRGVMDSTLIMGYRGEGPDIGAYDHGELIQGTPFRYMPPGPEVPFEEMPRITRHQTDGDVIKVWFSMPLAEGSVESADFKISTGGKIQDLNATGLTEDGVCLTLSTGQNTKLSDGDLQCSAGEMELLFSHWPEGKNGMPVTSWASAFPVRLYGQNPSEVLETTRKIADKIIRETVFDYKMVPLSYNGGITRFTVDEPAHARGTPAHTGGTSVNCASAKMNSEKDTGGLLGISFKGRIKLFLNNEMIFHGTSDSVRLQEYTYNRYRFHHKIPVQWKKGVNEILVKCLPDQEPGPVTLLMLPIDQMDAKEPHVSAEEVGFEAFYEDEDGDEDGKGDEMVTWKLKEVPMLRELVIPETNSYTRDSYADWHYANGGTMLGILSLYQVTKDETYLEFVKKFAE